MKSMLKQQNEKKGKEEGWKRVPQPGTSDARSKRKAEFIN
jgi:hypothetical protein